MLVPLVMVAALLAVSDRSTVDVLWGVGGTPEGVISAAAIKCTGGQLVGRLWPRDDEERSSLKDSGVSDVDIAKVYSCDEMACGNRILFAATGISDSALLRGIRFEDTAAVTTSILIRAKYQTVRYIRTVHNLDLKTIHLRSDASDHAL